ncbi:MAG: accessory gene regulator B family protein [Clostridia bacterium]|nr:accessory gene regulator B family protein [Clostridia bacterium]
MIDKISNKILEVISNKNHTVEEKEILLFGITRIVEDIPKTIGIIIIGLILGIIKEMAIVTLVIILYKTLTGGVHAKTNWGCFAYSVIFYLAIIYTSKFLVLTGISKYSIYVIIYIFSLYTIFVYVPADVPEIPKVNLSLRKSLKIKSFVMLNVIYLVSLICIKDVILQNLIIYSVFYISLMTTRTIYNLFKTDYGFETYIPDELI